MSERSGEILQGTVELLALEAVSLEAMHGWGLTAADERQLGREWAQWERTSGAVDWVLGWEGDV